MKQRINNLICQLYIDSLAMLCPLFSNTRDNNGICCILKISLHLQLVPLNHDFLNSHLQEVPLAQIMPNAREDKNRHPQQHLLPNVVLVIDERLFAIRVKSYFGLLHELQVKQWHND
jgi:hypothetical protein